MKLAVYLLLASLLVAAHCDHPRSNAGNLIYSSRKDISKENPGSIRINDGLRDTVESSKSEGNKNPGIGVSGGNVVYSKNLGDFNSSMGSSESKGGNSGSSGGFNGNSGTSGIDGEILTSESGKDAHKSDEPVLKIIHGRHFLCLPPHNMHHSPHKSHHGNPHPHHRPQIFQISPDEHIVCFPHHGEIHVSPPPPHWNHGAPRQESFHYETHGGQPFHHETHGGQPFHHETHGDQPFHPETHGGQPFHHETHGGQPFHHETHRGQPFHHETHGGQPFHHKTHGGQPFHHETNGGQPFHHETNGGQPFHHETHRGQPFHH